MISEMVTVDASGGRIEVDSIDVRGRVVVMVEEIELERVVEIEEELDNVEEGSGASVDVERVATSLVADVGLGTMEVT